MTANKILISNRRDILSLQQIVTLLSSLHSQFNNLKREESVIWKVRMTFNISSTLKTCTLMFVISSPLCLRFQSLTNNNKCLCLCLWSLTNRK